MPTAGGLSAPPEREPVIRPAPARPPQQGTERRPATFEVPMPDFPSTGISAEAVQVFLDVVATTNFPIVSEIAGLASGALYAWQGDMVGAVLSAAGIVPIIGTPADFVRVGRTARAVGAGADEVATGTVTVQRWMSQAELKATQQTGLLRGGRNGTHYVTDAANADALRARERLALPQTPEVRVTMEVPIDALSAPSRVNPAFNMPGGGMERTATGNVPVRIIKVD
jgi:hypothetical protein